MTFSILTVYCIAVVVFCAIFRFLKVTATASEIVGIANQAIAVVRNPDLDDLGKERQIQGLSLKMLKGFLAITIKGLLLVAGAALPALVAARFGVIDLQQIIAFSIRWDVVLITIVALTGVSVALRKKR